MIQKVTKKDTEQGEAKAYYTRKMAIAVSSISAAALLPAVAQAGTIYTNSSPKSVSLGGGNVVWDVDGDGATDFSLTTYTNSLVSLSLESSRDNASGVVKRTSDSSSAFRNLAAGFTVGATLAGGYQFYAENHYREVVWNSFSIARDAKGFTEDVTGYFGFKFKAGDGLTHYGWASMLIDLGPATPNFTIAEWGYNDVAGGSIQVGNQGAAPVPEPATLTTLALGAAALLAWRRKKNRKPVPQCKTS